MGLGAWSEWITKKAKSITTLSEKVDTLEQNAYDTLWVDYWQNTNPVSPTEGAVWFDSANNTMWCYTNSQWLNVPLSTNKIYINRVTELQYGWSGTAMVSFTTPLVFASQAEAEAGTDATKIMNSQRTLQSIVYQIVNKTFSDFNTTSKTVQGAINELKASVFDTSVKSFVTNEFITRGNFVKVRTDGKIEAIKNTTGYLNYTYKSDIQSGFPRVTATIIPNTNSSKILVISSDNNSIIGARVITKGTNGLITKGQEIFIKYGYGVSSSYVYVDFDPNNPNRFLVTTRDSYVQCISGTVQGDKITFGKISGSLLDINSDGLNRFLNFDINGSALICSTPANTTDLKLMAITLSSDNNFTNGSQVTANNHNGNYNDIIKPFSSNNGYYMVLDTSGTQLSLRIVSVSGTTVTVGTPIVISATCVSFQCASNSSNNKLAVIYSTATQTKLTILSISGTTLTIQSDNIISSSSASKVGICFTSVTDLILLTYTIGNSIKANTILLSSYAIGTTYTQVTLGNNVGSSHFNPYKGSSSAYFVHFGDSDNSLYGTFVPITLSSNQAVVGTKVAYYTSYTAPSNIKNDGNGLSVYSMAYTDICHILTLTSSSITNLNPETLIGVAQSTNVQIGDSINVKLLGAVDATQTGMSVGAPYYLNPSGSISSSSSAGGLLIGKSLSATELKTKELI